MTRGKKWLLIAASALVILAFFLAFFHHHEDEQESDCFVCKFIRQLVSFFAFVVLALLCPTRENFIAFVGERFLSSLFPSKLRNRAPPFLS